MYRSLTKTALLLSLSLCVTCTVSRVDPGGDDSGDAGMSGAGDDAGSPGPCVGLECQIPHCTGGQQTTLHGVVNIPAGTLPVYNATVYIPLGQLSPIPTGVSCNRCDTMLSGGPLVQTTTDTKGQFVLNKVPAGDNIPLVVQVGKWRRQVTLSSIVPCTDNAVAAEKTRLPRNKSEGNIPKIALTTGGADVLECLIRTLGIDDSEFTTETGNGRVNLYYGQDGTNKYVSTLNGGAQFTDAPTFWNDLNNLKNYDMIVHSCEGYPISTNKSAAALSALQDYLNMGGRVFASHYHHWWIEKGPAPFPSVAQFQDRVDLPDPTTATIDTSFAAGAAFADWLLNVGGSTQRGQLVLHAAKNLVLSIDSTMAQQWISIPNKQNIQYLSFDTPIGVDPSMQCGRMVLTDIHVAANSTPGMDFPSGCSGGALTPQEMALIYMFFGLSNCLSPIIG